MSAAGLLAPGVRYAASPVESRRFGREVARLTVGASDTSPGWRHEVAAAVTGSSADVIITRWHSRDTAVAGLLAELGRRVIPADNLAYWEIATRDLVGETGGADAECRSGDLEADELDALVLDIFADYPSHYSANPLLSSELALAGYREWAERTRATSPDLVVSLRKGDEAIGVATCAIEDGELDILLAGIATAHQGGGRYRSLLAGVAQLAARQRIERIVISTQVGNVNVQRAWARAGFVPFAVFATAHLVKAEV